MSNDWRFLKGSRVTVAHLWQTIHPLPGRFTWYKTRCSTLAVDDLLQETHSLTGEENLIRKCKKCIAFEIRRKETA